MAGVINDGGSRSVIAPEPEERDRIRQIVEALGKGSGDARYELTDASHRVTLELPPSLIAVLAQAAEALAGGQSVAIVHFDQELTTQQAADLLGVFQAVPDSFAGRRQDPLSPGGDSSAHPHARLDGVQENSRRSSPGLPVGNDPRL